MIDSLKIFLWVWRMSIVWCHRQLGPMPEVHSERCLFGPQWVTYIIYAAKGYRDFCQKFILKFFLFIILIWIKVLNICILSKKIDSWILILAGWVQVNLIFWQKNVQISLYKSLYISYIDDSLKVYFPT